MPAPTPHRAYGMVSKREELSLTQADLAAILQVSEAQVAAWESEKEPVPGVVDIVVSLLGDTIVPFRTRDGMGWFISAAARNRP